LESRWRLAKWEEGWGGTGFYLLAQLRGRPHFYVTQFAGKQSPIAIVQQYFAQPVTSPQGPRLEINTFFGVKPNGPGSPFPYGFAVVSDHD